MKQSSRARVEEPEGRSATWYAEARQDDETEQVVKLPNSIPIDIHE